MTNSQQIRKIATEINQLKLGLNTVADNSANLKHQWMTGLEVGHALNMSAKTLQRLRKSGSLPFSRVNGKIYYKRSDVDQMLEDNYQLRMCSCGCKK